MNEETKNSGDATQQVPATGASESDEAARHQPPEVDGESAATEMTAPAATAEIAEPGTVAASPDTPSDAASDEEAGSTEDGRSAPEEIDEVEVGDEIGEDEDEDEDENVEPLELILDEEPDEGDIEKDWFILKVQSNRESSIRDALARRVQVAGLDRFFGDIIVPTEDVAEFKAGKKKIVKRKMYPGYIVVHLAINDDTWFLVRETPGIGDFTGAAGKPTPMLPHEVDRILKAMKPETEGGETPKTAIPFKPGDRVRIKDGTFENFEGEVGGIDEANGRVTVMINIFNRTTPAELEHWQIEPL